MTVNAIIAEYNPFHNGHLFQLSDAKKAVDADFTIVVMSGNFVQRGAPALINKYKRTEMALKCGVDLVLELPMYYALSSAEFFASAAVSLIDKLGVVDYLCFGSECGNTDLLSKTAHLLTKEPADYGLALQKYLREGLSFPAARTKAIIACDRTLEKHLPALSSPNNILGIEYLKAIKKRSSTLKPYTTLRNGAAYHDETLHPAFCSAKAIRNRILSGENTAILADHMPDKAYAILASSVNNILSSDDFSHILHYKLLTEQTGSFYDYLDVSGELSDKISNHLEAFTGFEDFCSLLKSKDMTHTRISRCLFHILLGMTKNNISRYQSLDYTPYARILGFRKDAAPLLNAIKSNSSIPMITKLADTERYLPAEALSMLQEDIRMNRIYECTVAGKAKQPMLNEYRTPLIIV